MSGCRIQKIYISTISNLMPLHAYPSICASLATRHTTEASVTVASLRQCKSSKKKILSVDHVQLRRQEWELPNARHMGKMRQNSSADIVALLPFGSALVQPISVSHAIKEQGETKSNSAKELENVIWEWIIRLTEPNTLLVAVCVVTGTYSKIRARFTLLNPGNQGNPKSALEHTSGCSRSD